MNQGWIVRIPFKWWLFPQPSFTLHAQCCKNPKNVKDIHCIVHWAACLLLKSHALLGAFFPFCTVVGAMRWWRNRTGTVKWNNTSENPQNCCQYEVKLSPWHFEVTLECGEKFVCEAHTLSKYPLHVTTYIDSGKFFLITDNIFGSPMQAKWAKMSRMWQKWLAKKCYQKFRCTVLWWGFRPRHWFWPQRLQFDGIISLL